MYFKRNELRLFHVYFWKQLFRLVNVCMCILKTDYIVRMIADAVSNWSEFSVLLQTFWCAIVCHCPYK